MYKPYELLQKILVEKSLIATTTGYFRKNSVCLTEMTTRGLITHSRKYSAFGLAFLKEYIFNKGGGPALYLREELLKTSEIILDDRIQPFANKLNPATHDFHYEREWRLPVDLNFCYDDVFIVYAPLKYHKEIKNNFPEIGILLDIDLLSMI